MTAVLRASGVSVSFGGVDALAGLDLEVGEGELVGLIGPNGAGKTTFIDALTGFVPYRGGVELDGRDLRGLPAHQRARLGLSRTWQSTELFDDLSISENVNVAAHGRAAEDAVGEALGLVELGWAAELMPSDLSQGQRKLAGVARAIAMRPRLLCLDEPAAGLDTGESAELGRRLRRLADGGTSMLLIDHDMGLVLSICDRVYVLEFGKLIASGPPGAVRGDQRVVAAYLGSAAAEIDVESPDQERPDAEQSAQDAGPEAPRR